MMKTMSICLAALVTCSVLPSLGPLPVSAQEQNSAPYTPEITIEPESPTTVQDLSAVILGPDPADPDGDAVTYLYQWYKWDEVKSVWLMLPDIDGADFPSSETETGDVIRVEVKACDPYGAESPPAYAQVTIEGSTDRASVSWGNLKAIYR